MNITNCGIINWHDDTTNIIDILMNKLRLVTCWYNKKQYNVLLWVPSLDLKNKKHTEYNNIAGARKCTQNIGTSQHLLLPKNPRTEKNT